MRSANSEHGNSTSNRGCLYGLLLLVGIPLLLLVFVVLIYFGRESSARGQLSTRIESIEAQGLPVDNASMTVYHRQLTSNEDTQAWLDALGEINSDDFQSSIQGVPLFDRDVEDEGLPRPGGEWPQETVVREFLDKHQSLVGRLTDLSHAQLTDGARPVRFPIKFNSVNTALQNTQDMRQAARLLMLRGRLATFDRDSQATRQSIEGLLGNAQALKGEPILVSQLVSLAIDSMAINSLKTALEQDVLQPEDLQILREHILQRTQIGPQWRWALHGERAMALPVFINPSAASGMTPPTSRLMPLGRSRDALYFLDYLDNVLSVNTEDLDEFVDGVEKTETKFRQLVASGFLARMDSVLTSLMVPATSTSGKAFVRQAMMNRLAALAIGVRQFEQQHGRVPETLQELEKVGLQVTQLEPPGGRPFGYQTDQTTATFWGFDINLEKSTPAEVPAIDPAEPDAERQQTWTWKLP